MRNVGHILQAIKDYKGIKTNAGLAGYLGVSRSAISNWIARGTLDEKLIMSKIPEITLKFLRTGEYPMTEQHDVIGNLLKRIELLERRIEKLEKYGNLGL
jgi:hypothetical protein